MRNRRRRGDEITLPHPHSDHRVDINILAPMSVTLDNQAGGVHEIILRHNIRQLPVNAGNLHPQ